MTDLTPEELAGWKKRRERAEARCRKLDHVCSWCQCSCHPLLSAQCQLEQHEPCAERAVQGLRTIRCDCTCHMGELVDKYLTLRSRVEP